ncbi:MAG: ECF transporter S component [Firmicutes bacterium]|nr:ECF transporter S component [Bacillota bacterium]
MQTERVNKSNAKRFAVLGMLSAIAFVAKLISSVFPMVSGFLSFDLKDVIIVIAGFMMGPVASVLISVVVSIVEMLTISSTGPIGLLMNVLASCAFACTASIIYHRKRKMSGAVAGLIAGILVMTAVMILWNWLITPLYMGVPREVVEGMLVPVFIPFNLLKGGINATLTMLLYKPIVEALRKARLIDENPNGNRTTKWGVIAISLVLLATFVLLGLVLAGVI